MGITQSTSNNKQRKHKYSDDEIKQNIQRMFFNNQVVDDSSSVSDNNIMPKHNTMPVNNTSMESLNFNKCGGFMPQLSESANSLTSDLNDNNAINNNAINNNTINNYANNGDRKRYNKYRIESLLPKIQDGGRYGSYESSEMDFYGLSAENLSHFSKIIEGMNNNKDDQDDHNQDNQDDQIDDVEIIETDEPDNNADDMIGGNIEEEEEEEDDEEKDEEDEEDEEEEDSEALKSDISSIDDENDSDKENSFDSGIVSGESTTSYTEVTIDDDENSYASDTINIKPFSSTDTADYNFKYPSSSVRFE